MLETAIYIDYRRRPRLLIRNEGIADDACPWIEEHIRELYQDYRVGKRTRMVSDAELTPKGDADYNPDAEGKGGEESEGDARCNDCWDQGCDGCNCIADDSEFDGGFKDGEFVSSCITEDGEFDDGCIAEGGEFDGGFEDGEFVSDCIVEDSGFHGEGDIEMARTQDTARFEALSAQDITLPPSAVSLTSAPLLTSFNSRSAPIISGFYPPPAPPPSPQSIPGNLEVRSSPPSPKLIYENGHYLYDITHF